MERGDKHIEPFAPLIEELAEAVHNGWAEERRRSGWRYGAERDDVHMLHPCLVPYEELSESEREVDRCTVIATLTAIQRLGYKIVKG
jgi:ryanodine receptor 2